MGVLACDRRSCKNIMCDKILDNCYICNECYEELQGFISTLPEKLTEEQIHEEFKKFMETKPGRYREVSREEFEKVLGYRER